ncbi:MAG TPA: hypothetical protein VI757_00380 [Bacteroidia bacterium]|nr:hypothetical protein [Bacteroidia bacterium]
MYLYALNGYSSNSFSGIEYSRTSVLFTGLCNHDSLVKLPLTYFDNMTARNATGEKIPILKGEDGFAYLANTGNINQVFVSSFSLVTLFSLAAPIIGFALMLILHQAGRKKGTS